MMWVFAVLIVGVMGVIAMLAAGRGEPMGRAYDDRPDVLVPADRPLTAADLRRVRFPLALRGYRMGDVDALLARLAAELEAGEPETRPREQGPDQGPPPHPSAARPADPAADPVVDPVVDPVEDPPTDADTPGPSSGAGR